MDAHDIVLIIAAVGSAAATIISAINNRKVEQVKRIINGTNNGNTVEN